MGAIFSRVTGAVARVFSKNNYGAIEADAVVEHQEENAGIDAGIGASKCNNQSETKIKRKRGSTGSKIKERPSIPCKSKSMHLPRKCKSLYKLENKVNTTNGWHVIGKKVNKFVFVNNTDKLELRRCCFRVEHVNGTRLQKNNYVLLRPQKTNELPCIGKIDNIFLDKNMEIMLGIYYYYRAAEFEIQPCEPNEVYASKHRAHVSVSCVNDKCFVISSKAKKRNTCFRDKCIDVVPMDEGDCEASKSPNRPVNKNAEDPNEIAANVDPRLVFICRKSIDPITKRIIK